MSPRTSGFGLTILLALGVGTAFAQPADQGCVELKTEGAVEQSYVDENGRPAVRLVPAARVVPGDEVVWTISASNICEAPVADIAITNPVPAHMRYVNATAFGSGTTFGMSIDGREFNAPESLRVQLPDGSTRPADAGDIKHIRWQLGQALAPSETLIVGYRATVL